MAITTVTIRNMAGQAAATVTVDESSMEPCGYCGDDLYVHEWIQLDSENETRDCDRA